MNRPDLKDFTLDKLTGFVQNLGLPSFRAVQIFSWLYRPGISEFSQMTDISKELREKLTGKAVFSRLCPETEEISKDGTRKFAFRLDDQAVIESVLIPEEDRHTLCVSSQVGCAMGCRFCLTGKQGFKRNLRAAEIVNQVYAVSEKLHNEGKGRINNLVFMGMGEPLANLENLIDALNILMEQRGLDFSSRRITVSTCGLVPKIKELGERVTVNLAVSLHAVDDAVRSSLMPVNNSHPVEELLAACREFPLPKRRKIMFEYILMNGVNDAPADARQLVKKLHKISCKINLLPYNETSTSSFSRPSGERIEAFQKIIREAGFTVLIRSSRGADISAACGQLAGKTETIHKKGSC